MDAFVSDHYNSASSPELSENITAASPIGQGWRPGTSQGVQGSWSSPRWLFDKEDLAERVVQQALEQLGYLNVGQSKWIICGKVRNFRQATSEKAVKWQLQLTPLHGAAGFPLVADSPALPFIAVEMEVWAFCEPLMNDI
jgi:hypothetical protein